MLLVALIVVAATTVGIVAYHRTAAAPVAARRALALMLWVLIPFVSYVNFAHLQLSLGAGVGLLLGYIGLGIAGSLAWSLGKRIGMARSAFGGLICTVILANTGYLGLPMAIALLGTHALPHAVAWDQVISGPMVFTAGFAVGAAFGTGERAGAGIGERLKLFLTRNPPLWGAVAGLLVPAGWAPNPLPYVSRQVIEAMLVLGFFAVGVYLSSERREEHAPLFQRPDRVVAISLVCRFLVNPALLGAVALLGVGIPSAYFLQAAMPCGINGLIVGHAFGLDQRLIATSIMWSTLLVVAVGVIVQLV